MHSTVSTMTLCEYITMIFLYIYILENALSCIPPRTLVSNKSSAGFTKFVFKFLVFSFHTLKSRPTPHIEVIHFIKEDTVCVCVFVRVCVCVCAGVCACLRVCGRCKKVCLHYPYVFWRSLIRTFSVAGHTRINAFDGQH